MMYRERTARLIEQLKASELDALLVTSLPNIQYLSGFTGSTALVLVSPAGSWFITDSRYTERVGKTLEPCFTLVDNTGLKLVEEVLPTLDGATAFKRVGFEAAHMNVAAQQRYSAAAKFTWVPTENLVEDLRIIKDESEIELIRQAVLLGERIFTELLGVCGPDTTENDLAAEISYRAMKYGAEGVSFSPIIATGPNSAMPHASYTSQKLVPGAPLTFDMGVRLNGYISDMTRTVFYKDCPEKWARIYNIVREAKDLAASAIKPGLLGKQIDAVARNIISKQGYGENFGHGLGHGVGIEVHEQPRLAKVSETELKPGMCVTDEPGIYLPGEGGIRIEDILVVRPGGAENLNTLETGIKVIG
jgi:Xaa-Pro aminopeptidase